MTSKEKENTVILKPTEMSPDEMCTKRFMFCAFNKLMARHRNVTYVQIDRDKFADDVCKFLKMKPNELSLYEANIKDSDLEIRGEKIIKKIFSKYNL